MATRKKLSKKKITRFLILFVSLIAICITLFMVINNSKKKPDAVVVDKLDEYGYSLKDSSTAYYKTLFSELKVILNSEEIDYEKYATTISKLFLTDFFTLSNKNSKNDIGGVEFVYSDYKEDFSKLASTTIYKNIINNITGNRSQSLPTVKEISLIEIIEDEYDHFDNEGFAYFLKFEIKYVKDLDYQEEVSLILMHNNNKLEIVEMK